MTPEFIEGSDGRRVELTGERWEHIVGTHGELADHREDVLRAVRQPELRFPSRETNEEWLLVGGIGPSRWLQVLVAYGEGRGWIVTAFARRLLPRQS